MTRFHTFEREQLHFGLERIDWSLRVWIALILLGGSHVDKAGGAVLVWTASGRAFWATRNTVPFFASGAVSFPSRLTASARFNAARRGCSFAAVQFTQAEVSKLHRLWLNLS